MSSLPNVLCTISVATTLLSFHSVPIITIVISQLGPNSPHSRSKWLSNIHYQYSVLLTPWNVRKHFRWEMSLKQWRPAMWCLTPAFPIKITSAVKWISPCWTPPSLVSVQIKLNVFRSVAKHNPTWTIRRVLVHITLADLPFHIDVGKLSAGRIID